MNKKNLINIAIVFLCGVILFSSYNIYKKIYGYKKGQDEYKNIAEIANNIDENNNKKEIDFDELLSINQDTVAWIKFQKEPSIINYPVVQTDNNEEYLYKTFKKNENTVGAIFMDYENNPNFKDKNTIIYGHRMYDATMFNGLKYFSKKEYRDDNPYFDIYTVDGRKLTYKIFAVSEVLDDSDIYNVNIKDDKAMKKFIEESLRTKKYDTGIIPKEGDYIVTLSTCLVANEDSRLIVQGILEKEEKID